MNLENLAEEFRANGFVVARGLFEADLLQDVTAEGERGVDAVIASGGYDRMYFDDEAELSSGRTASAVRCVFRMQDLSDFLRNLLESPTLNDLARTLLGDEPVADGIQYIDKPPGSSYEFPYHQDNAYMFHEPPLALGIVIQILAPGGVAIHAFVERLAVALAARDVGPHPWRLILRSRDGVGLARTR